MTNKQTSHSHTNQGKISCLGQVPIFNKLGPTETLALSEIIRPARYQKGEIIQQAGDNTSRLLVLNRGRAKVSRTTTDGREQVLRILNPGDFTGELTVFTKEAAGSDIVALETTTFCTIDGESLTKLMSNNSSLALTFIGELSRRLEITEQHVQAVGLLSAEQRLAEAITDIAAGRSQFRLPMAKKDLASQIGISPETLSRKLREWEKNGIIEQKGQREVKIIKIEELS